MATGQKMSYSDMEATSKRFGTEKTNLEKSIRNMQGLIDKLPQIWQGDTATAYQERFTKIKNSIFKNAVELMDELQKNIKTYADEQKTIDEKNAKKLK